MKLNFFQLEAQLSKKLSSIYIISGDELLLKQDAIGLIRKAAKQAGFNERIRFTPEVGSDWDSLYNLLYSTSFLADKRLIELDFRDALPTQTASHILKEYAEKPINDNLLLIDITKLDKKITKNAWYQALEKVSILVSIWPIAHEQLPQWIINRAKKYKLQFNLDAARLLSDYVEGNLAAAIQAIEKIYLSKPQAMVDISLVKTILLDESRFTVFDFIENLIASNITRAFHILEVLKEEGTEPALILWGITRELRLLGQMSQQLKQGLSFENLWQKHRIFARRQNALRHFLTHQSTEACWKHLSQAVEIDHLIKGATQGNIWNALQLFCLRFSSKETA